MSLEPRVKARDHMEAVKSAGHRASYSPTRHRIKPPQPPETAPRSSVTASHLAAADGGGRYLLMEETLGTFSWSQTASASSRSRISHANIVAFSRLYLQMASTTRGVATFGLLPPMTPGLIDPVS